MSKVDADPAEIRKFQSQLKGYNRELERITRSLQSNLTSLQQSWRDEQSRRFAGEMDVALRAIKRYMAESREYEKYLDKVARPLEDYGSQGRR